MKYCGKLMKKHGKGTTEETSSYFMLGFFLGTFTKKPLIYISIKWETAFSGVWREDKVCSCCSGVLKKAR